MTDNVTGLLVRQPQPPEYVLAHTIAACIKISIATSIEAVGQAVRMLPVGMYAAENRAATSGGGAVGRPTVASEPAASYYTGGLVARVMTILKRDGKAVQLVDASSSQVKDAEAVIESMKLMTVIFYVHRDNGLTKNEARVSTVYVNVKASRVATADDGTPMDTSTWLAAGTHVYVEGAVNAEARARLYSLAAAGWTLVFESVRAAHQWAIGASHGQPSLGPLTFLMDTHTSLHAYCGKDNVDILAEMMGHLEPHVEYVNKQKGPLKWAVLSHLRSRNADDVGPLQIGGGRGIGIELCESMLVTKSINTWIDHWLEMYALKDGQSDIVAGAVAALVFVCGQRDASLALASGYRMREAHDDAYKRCVATLNDVVARVRPT